MDSLLQTKLFIPQMDASEAALIPDLEVIPVPSLAELHAHLDGVSNLEVQEPTKPESVPISVQTDFKDIKDQEHVKRTWKSLPLESKMFSRLGQQPVAFSSTSADSQYPGVEASPTIELVKRSQ